jgi:hypothetical protein
MAMVSLLTARSMRALTVLLLFSALFAQEVRAKQRVALVLGNSD